MSDMGSRVIEKLRLRAGRANMPVTVNISARHLHVTKEVFENTIMAEDLMGISL